MNNDLIGIILWQNNKDIFLNLIEKYSNLFVKSKLKVISVESFNLLNRKNFIKNIYYPEPIPSNNIKIILSEPVILITIQDNMPNYTLETSSSGCSIYCNRNGLELKRYLRIYYNWTYIHSTDNLEQYFIILEQLNNYGTQNIKGVEVKGLKHIKILNDIYNGYVPNQCRALVFPKSGNTFNNINTHPKCTDTNMKELEKQLFINTDNVYCGRWEKDSIPKVPGKQKEEGNTHISKNINYIDKLEKHPTYLSLSQNNKEIYKNYLKIEQSRFP